MAAIAAGLGLVKGAGGAIAAKKSFSPEMEERKRELERLRGSGELGMSEADRQGLEASLMTQRSAGLRQAQTIGEQQRQAAGGSGRELFLAEVAAQGAEQQARTQQAEVIASQEMAAAQAQQQELAALQAQQAQAKAQAIAAFTGGVVEGGQAAVGMGMQQQAQQQALEMQRLQADAQIRAAAAAAGYTTPESITTGYMGG